METVPLSFIGAWKMPASRGSFFSSWRLASRARGLWRRVWPLVISEGVPAGRKVCVGQKSRPVGWGAGAGKEAASEADILPRALVGAAAGTAGRDWGFGPENLGSGARGRFRGSGGCLGIRPGSACGGGGRRYVESGGGELLGVVGLSLDAQNM